MSVFDRFTRKDFVFISFPQALIVVVIENELKLFSSFPKCISLFRIEERRHQEVDNLKDQG